MKCISNTLFLKFIITMLEKSKIPILAYIDNKFLDKSLRSTQQVKKKCLRIDIAEVQHMLESKEINEINWIPSKENLADGLTKRGIDTSVLLHCISARKFKINAKVRNLPAG